MLVLIADADAATRASDSHGLELASRLRALQCTPPCYVVAVADAADPKALQAAMASGADDFLARPFHDEHLHVRIQVAGRFMLQARRLTDQESSLEQARHARRACARTDALTGL